MQLQWRHLRPGELDHELMWLLVSVAAAAAAMAWLAMGLPWPRCTFLALTGLPCFTCGATRTGLAFFQGDFAVAWQLNPLVSLLLCALVVFDLYAVAVLAIRGPRLRITFTRPRIGRAIAVLVVLIALVNWLYVLSRA